MEFILLLATCVFYISRSQASLERKIFRQIVFYDRVGKEAVDRGGKKMPPSNRADPFLPLAKEAASDSIAELFPISQVS